MASLTDSQKSFVVIELACFASPTSVREQLEAKGVTVTLDQVIYYDPTGRRAKKPAQKWIDLFDATRAEYLAGELATAIANRRWRLDQLQQLYDNTKSPKLRMELMQQAAKEVGDAYSNTRRHRLTGKDDDSPIQTQSTIAVIEMPDNGRGDRPMGALTPRGEPSG